MEYLLAVVPAAFYLLIDGALAAYNAIVDRSYERQAYGDPDNYGSVTIEGMANCERAPTIGPFTLLYDRVFCPLG